MISYLGITGLVAGVLTFVFIFSRPIHERDEVRSWRVWMKIFAVCFLLPYATFEGLTKWKGPEMVEAVDFGLRRAKVKGDLDYFKVIFYNGNAAIVLAVAKEQANWGGTDRPVMRMKIVKKGDDWTLDDVEIVYSEDRNKDGIVLPPYY